jgi:hypothetical protein
MFAPLLSAAAVRVQGYKLEDAMLDATKLSNAVLSIVRAVKADIAVAEFASGWDIESLGFTLAALRDGTAPPDPVSTSPQNGWTLSARGEVLLDSIRRLRVVLGEESIVAASVTGPVSLSSLTSGKISIEQAAQRQLGAVRALSEAGAQVIWFVETSPAPAEPADVARALAPLAGTVRFYDALPVLHATGEGDSWLPIATSSTIVTTFVPGQSPELAEAARTGALSYGIATPPGEPDQVTKELVRGKGCVLVTHEKDLDHEVETRDLHTAIARLRTLAQSPPSA